MKKRILAAVLCLVLVFTLFPVSAFALEPAPVNTVKVVFGKSMPYNSYHVYIADGSSEIMRASSSNPSVASVKVTTDENPWMAEITPKKAGNAVIHVADLSGREADVKVTVQSSWALANLKSQAGCSVYYGFKKADVWSRPGSKVTIRIGGKKFSRKVGKSGRTRINVGRSYKYGKKYKVTYSYNGARYTQTRKVQAKSYVYIPDLNPNSKVIPLNLFYGVKGDVVIVSVLGTHYKKKIRTTRTKQTLKFKTSYWNGILDVINVIVKNKYGQVLYMIDSPVNK